MPQKQIQKIQLVLDFAKNTYLANLKPDVDILDSDKLKKCINWFKHFEK